MSRINKADLPPGGRLDGDALAGLHRAHLGQHPAVVVEVVLPEALVDESIGLIGATVDHCAHEPAGRRQILTCQELSIRHHLSILA